ncbi:ANTAR domain-containing protein [Candidatus Peregrinibacteria bacterium]|nr:ANTAR domain-containing protein [Candidatus Peregrinibacteria bacterium]
MSSLSHLTETHEKAIDEALRLLEAPDLKPSQRTLLIGTVRSHVAALLQETVACERLYTDVIAKEHALQCLCQHFELSHEQAENLLHRLSQTMRVGMDHATHLVSHSFKAYQELSADDAKIDPADQRVKELFPVFKTLVSLTDKRMKKKHTSVEKKARIRTPEEVKNIYLAKAIIMDRLELSEDIAYKTLQKLAGRNNLKMENFAERAISNFDEWKDRLIQTSSQIKMRTFVKQADIESDKEPDKGEE